MGEGGVQSGLVAYALLLLYQLPYPPLILILIYRLYQLRLKLLL